MSLGKKYTGNRMEINVFLFDWSGTISDDRNPVYKANLLMHQDFGIQQNLSFEEWARSASVSVVQAFQNLGVRASAEEIEQTYRRRLNEVVLQDSAPTMYVDAVETLQTLKDRGARLAVLSAHPAFNLAKEAESYGLYEYFDLLIGDCRNKIDGLKELVKTLSAEPSKTLYTGDTIYDVRAAKEAGLLSAGITTGYHSAEALEAEHPDFLFQSLHDVHRLC